MKTERSVDKLGTTVKLPKYEKWGCYEQWLPMNVERIALMFIMDH